MHLRLGKQKGAWSEQQLAEGCSRGDNDARRVLYERYGGRMLAICMRYVGVRETAEDLLQDGFLKLFGLFDKFTWRGEGSLSAWMSRFFANEALMYLRRNDAIRQSIALDDTGELPSDMDRPDEMPDEVDTIPEDVLMRFIEELPVGYRTVFNMYVFEGKNHIQIAQELGIQQKSSSSQLARARAILVKKVNEWRKKNEG